MLGANEDDRQADTAGLAEQVGQVLGGAGDLAQVAVSAAGGPLGMAEIVLHVDDDERGLARVNLLRE